jgi:hypothetical protein
MDMPETGLLLGGTFSCSFCRKTFGYKKLRLRQSSLPAGCITWQALDVVRIFLPRASATQLHLFE